MKADAVVFSAPDTVEFRRVDCPDPGPDDVVIRLAHSWISNGTEGSYLRGERLNGDTPRRPGDPTPFPIVPGYQKVGVVESVGGAIADLAVGETVFCACSRVEGMFHPIGGHVSPSVAPREQVWKLPPRPEPLAFSGLLLAQVGYNCGARAPLEAGDPALVIGDGLVGQWTAQTLASRGARVVMVGRDDRRLAVAAETISCAVISAKTRDWAAEARRICEGGVAVAVDTAGSPEATERVITLCRHGGHIVSAGYCGMDDRVSLQALRDLELTLCSVAGMTRPRMDATVGLIADGRMETLPLITHRFPAREAAAAWDVIRSRKELVLGVILDW